MVSLQPLLRRNRQRSYIARLIGWKLVEAYHSHIYFGTSVNRVPHLTESRNQSPMRAHRHARCDFGSYIALL